jgi:hypothetical protein
MTSASVPRPRDPTISLSARAGFAASGLILAGGFHLVNGYTTLEHKSYLASTNVIYNNLTFWGWAFLIWGAISIIAGVMLLTRSITGAALAVAIAEVAAFMWFIMIFAAPFAALVGVGLNMLIVWAITSGVHEDLGP